MKAKEYIKILEEGNYDVKCVGTVIKMLISEYSSLTKVRKVRTILGIDACMKEIKQKWIAICRRSNNRLIEDGFQKLLIKEGIVDDNGNVTYDVIVKYNVKNIIYRE